MQPFNLSDRTVRSGLEHLIEVCIFKTTWSVGKKKICRNQINYFSHCFFFFFLDMLKGIRSPTYLGIEYLTRNARIRRHDGHYVRLHRHGDAVCFQQRVTALLCDTEGHTSRDRDVLTVKHQGLGSPLSSILAARSQATFQLSLPLFLSTHKKYTSSHLVSHVLFFLDSVLFFISTANKTSAAALWKCSYYRGNQQRAVCVSS